VPCDVKSVTASGRIIIPAVIIGRQFTVLWKNLSAGAVQILKIYTWRDMEPVHVGSQCIDIEYDGCLINDVAGGILPFLQGWDVDFCLCSPCRLYINQSILNDFLVQMGDKFTFQVIVAEGCNVGRVGTDVVDEEKGVLCSGVIIDAQGSTGRR